MFGARSRGYYNRLAIIAADIISGVYSNVLETYSLSWERCHRIPLSNRRTSLFAPGRDGNTGKSRLSPFEDNTFGKSESNPSQVTNTYN